MARLAAIEAQLARYIRIECGHFTTLDAQDMYLICKPKAGTVYCETCHKWLAVAKPPAPKVQPQTPMF